MYLSGINYSLLEESNFFREKINKLISSQEIEIMSMSGNGIKICGEVDIVEKLYDNDYDFEFSKHNKVIPVKRTDFVFEKNKWLNNMLSQKTGQKTILCHKTLDIKEQKTRAFLAPGIDVVEIIDILKQTMGLCFLFASIDEDGRFFCDVQYKK